MVGIVVVAHCKKLAEGTKELADQMVRGKARIAVVVGLLS